MALAKSGTRGSQTMTYRSKGMKQFVVLLLFAGSLQAETVPRRLYKWSVAALVAGNVADASSSWGGNELNPLAGRGRYGVSQVSVKALVLAGPLLLQWRLRRPQNERVFTITNFAVGGSLAGLAIRNWKVR
jgi:hypothetical protein